MSIKKRSDPAETLHQCPKICAATQGKGRKNVNISLRKYQKGL